MESIEKFRLQIIFRNISYLITNRIVDLPKSSQNFLVQADVFFDNLIKSLNSLNYSENIEQSVSNTYHFLPNLKEIVNLSKQSSTKLKSADLIKIRDYFIWVRSELKKLYTNPEEFYSSTDINLIKDITDRIGEVYTDNHLFYHNESEIKSISTIPA